MVKPSRLLLVLVGIMCLAILCAAAAIGFCSIGELSDGSRLLAAGSCVLVAILGGLRTLCARKAFRIDISGVGQIRLMEYNELAASSGRTEWPHAEEDGEVVQLMEGSTIWPHFMFLRLQNDSGKVNVLPILRDSMTEEGFRALMVACRWIAAHNIRAESTTV